MRTQPRRARIVAFIGTNRTEEAQTVTVTISIDNDRVLDDTIQFHAERDTSIGEFEKAGEYHVSAESDGHSRTETMEIREDYLRDCNYTTGLIHLDEDGVRIDVERTVMGCK